MVAQQTEIKIYNIKMLEEKDNLKKWWKKG